MTLHFALQPGVDRGTSIELPSRAGGISGSDRAVGRGQLLPPRRRNTSQQSGTDRSMHRSEGSLSLEFATQEGMSYVVESTQDLATGQWEAITTIEGSGHEVIGMPTTEQAQAYLRVREVSGSVGLRPP